MFSAFTYIIIVHCQTQFDLLFSIIMNCVTYSVLYENLTCSISTGLNSPGMTWKMDVNGPGKSWKSTFGVLYTPCSLLCCVRLMLMAEHDVCRHLPSLAAHTAVVNMMASLLLQPLLASYLTT